MIPSLSGFFDARNDSRRAINNKYGHGGYGGNKDTTRVNNRISANQVRVIDSDGTQLGIKPLSEALAIARQKGFDLIEIAPTANPPVCKILDYSKYKYEQDKKVRESRRKQKAGLLKEVRFKPHIGMHDLEVKIKHISEFLAAHDKVRITVVFKGREMQHKDIGMKLLDVIKERLVAQAAVEQEPMPDRNRLIMTLIPKH
ncbi:MAG: translation initiation factor IF-3 [Elusimicrobia bacterium]|nr:translation initiation factor IF-3 [Elusimicrobiota bacterium]